MEKKPDVKKGLSLERLVVGQTHEHSVVISEEMIRLFAEATGDFNPIHLDEDFARSSAFERRVAHGLLTAGVMSGVLGTRFPGLGTIYLSQTLKFVKPVFIGDEITVRLKVLEIIPAKNRLRLETVCLNQDGEAVLVGEAVVLPPQ